MISGSIGRRYAKALFGLAVGAGDADHRVGQDPTGELDLAPQGDASAHGLVITSYSIHYTKLYDVRSERLAALGSLAASLAHDINNPLSTITSGASVSSGFASTAAAQVTFGFVGFGHTSYNFI